MSTEPTLPEDTQGDARWMSMVSHYFGYGLDQVYSLEVYSLLNEAMHG